VLPAAAWYFGFYLYFVFALCERKHEIQMRKAHVWHRELCGFKPEHERAMSKRSNEQNDAILHQNLPLVEVAESWLLDTILADAGAARAVVARLSDRVAVVAPGQLDALLARLRKLGHTPKVLER
jgi:hypothetical protein